MTETFKGFLALAATTIMFSFYVLPANADDLEKIRKTGELSIAMSGQYPPFNFVNDNNEVVGFDAAIGSAIAERMGVKARIVTTPFDGIIAGVLANKYDTVIGSTAITPERQKAVDFVGPYYHAGRTIIVKENSPIQALEDLKGKTVGVILGDTHDKWARAQGDFNIRTYKALPELLLELDASRIDAIVMDRIPVMVAIKETGQKIRRLDTPDIEGGDVSVGIAIRKNNPDLKAAMQAALDAIMADGTYEKIAMEWVGSDIR